MTPIDVGPEDSKSNTDSKTSDTSTKTDTSEAFEDITLEDQIRATYNEDPWVQEVLQALESGQRLLKGFPLAESEARNGRVYYRDRLLVPNNTNLRLRLVREAHDGPAAGHPRRTKTYEILYRYY